MNVAIVATDTETETIHDYKAHEEDGECEDEETPPSSSSPTRTVDRGVQKFLIESNGGAREGTEADDDRNDYDEGPVDGVGCQQGCARDQHVTLTILSIGLLLAPVLLGTEMMNEGAFLVLEVILGVLYLFLVLNSSTFEYLLNMNTTKSVMDYMDQMYQTEPVIKWFIQCYHFEQRSRRVATLGPNGTTIYQTICYRKRVNTHSAHGRLAIARWADISTPLDRHEIEGYRMTKISVTKRWVDDEGVHEQKRDFIRMNDVDALYDFSETLELAEYRSRFLGFNDLNDVPPLVHWGWYLVSHLTVVFGVPYRMWLSSKSHKVRTTIVKQVWTK